MSTNDIFHICLLDMLAMKARCVYLSDLHYLKQWERVRLARVLEEIHPDSVPLFEWNDTLKYLAQESPQQEPQAARDRLIVSLYHPLAGCAEDRDRV